MTYKRVIFTLPQELFNELDKAVKIDFKKRSAYIREAILLKMQLEAAIESEVGSRQTMESVIKSLHAHRLITRRMNQDGPLNWSQLQD
jgi:metal-responsive CopG/Arc/MetJ family transcriptional regulator